MWPPALREGAGGAGERLAVSAAGVAYIITSVNSSISIIISIIGFSITTTSNMLISISTKLNNTTTNNNTNNSNSNTFYWEACLFRPDSARDVNQIIKR